MAINNFEDAAAPFPPTSDGIVDGENTSEVMNPEYNDAAGATNSGGDIIDGADGDNDTILGNGGDDTINAGLGTDEVYGGSGNDVIDGGEGDDTIVGDFADGVTDVVADSSTVSGNDTLVGGAGNDSISGGDGNDMVYGDADSTATVADTTDTTTAANYQVIYLATIGTDLDPTETGGTSGISESAGLINGATYGTSDNPLSANIVTMTAGVGNGDDQYDGDNTVSNETFTISNNPGTTFTFDSATSYIGSVITYADGTTATVSAVVFQDTYGDLFLAPEYTVNGDTAAYTEKAITSIELGTADTSGVSGNNGLTLQRVVDSWVAFDGAPTDVEDGNDTIDGGAGQDTLIGGGADDTIDGGEGADIIYGDSAGADVAAPADSVNTTTALNFQVISLGNSTIELDPIEAGGTTTGMSENGGLLNGATFGSSGDPLSDNVEQMVVGTGNGDGQYDGDATVSVETFFINGIEQTYDGLAVYDNTIITYVDGTTATVSAVVFQDTDGNLYLAPEFSNNADTTAYTAQPISSIELGTHNTDPTMGNGLVSSRVVDSWVEHSATDAGANDGDDVITGGEGADTIFGEGGDDTIDGGADNDVIYGDSGGNEATQAADRVDTTTAPNFQVISLGNSSIELDPIEAGGTTTGFSENGGLFNGSTFGSTDDPLSGNVATMVAGTGNGDGQYDGDSNVSNDTFFINGVEHTYDGLAVYENTIITYADGTTAAVSAVVFQDTDGNLYLAPEFSNNADTTDYTAQPITSIQLGTQNTDPSVGNGLVVSRVVDSWVETSATEAGANDGDDVITGGEGADTMFGEGGNDTFVVGSASEGAGDVIDGGNGPDENTDLDVLDLTGAGNVTIDDAADANDAGATAGIVTFEDGSTLAFEGIEQIITDPQNEAPMIDPIADETIPENSTDPVFTAAATDPDGDDVTYSLEGPDADLFDIDPDTGVVTPVAPLDFENPTDDDGDGVYDVTVVATDPKGLRDEEPVAITVEDVNEAPVLDPIGPQTAPENSTDPVFTANAVDPDGDQPVYSLTGPDADLFDIDPDTGEVTPVAPLDADNPTDDNGDGVYDITVVATDPEGLTDEEPVAITVGDVNEAPDAINDVAETDEDTPLVIDVLDNDTDPDDDPLTITAASVPADQGTVEIVDDLLVFTPAENFNGEATISYAITDGNGGTDVAEVVVTVNPINDDPVAGDDIVSTDEGEPVTIPVLENDTDVDGDPLTITSATVPADQGTVEIVDGALVFTPAPNFVGPADIAYTIDDGNGGTDEGTATVNVGDAPGAPVAVDDTAETDEDTPVTIDVLDNDTDPDGDPLTITGASVPTDQGTVEVVNNQLVFTPADDFNGEATITYSITDGNGGTDVAEVAVTVNPVNDDPVAVDDIENTDEDEPVVVDLLGNDVDPDGDELTLVEATVPADQGTLVDNGDGTVTFTPAPGFTGPAEITYTVTDPDGATDEGTATVNVGAVNDSPVAVDDSDTTEEDTPITVDLLDNDSDPDGDDIRVISATVPEEQGTVVLNDGGTVTFTPAEDFTGEAEINYTISDGNGLTDTASHFVTVTPVNDAPVAAEDPYDADEDTVEVIGNVLDNDEDPEGDPLTVAEVNGDPAGVGQPVAGDNGGLVTIAEDGTVTFDPNGEFEELRPGESVQTSITYTVTDPDGGTATETVTITVDGVNDAPDAVENVYIVDASEGFGDVDGNVLTDNTGDGTDNDPENTALKVVAVGGAVAGVGTVVAGDNGGQFIINEDGTIDFNANGDFDGLPLGETAQTSVTYTIEDEDGGTDTASVTFTVDGVNDGTVQGTSGDDVIVPGYVDPDGDIVDGNDAILPGDTGNDDLIFGFEGDDNINAGDGDDEVFGGIGNDTIAGGDGNDTLMGNAGNDVISGEDGDDRAFGGEGDDAIDGGAGNDVLEGSEGDDVVDGGDGDDDIWGGLDNDTLFGGDGNDTVGGGDGDDLIDTSTPNLDASPDIGYPGLYPADTDPNDDLDTVFGGAGNDSIITGDDDDIIFAGSGDDTVDAGWDDDVVEGGTGNDTIIGGEGNDEIFGDDGNDLIFGGLDNDAPDFVNIPDDGSGPFGSDLVTNNSGDTLFGGNGNDTIFGKDDDDTLFGGEGNDIIDGGFDDDQLDGDAGDDTLLGGQGDDTLLGGDGDDVIIGGEGDDVQAGGFGSDTFIGGNGGDNVVGGEDPDGNDIDVLDLTGTDIDNIEYTDGDPESGVVTFQDGTTMTFAEIENVIPCFTPGTMIATPTGEKPVEDLREGDRIITRDNGIQEIAWAGRKVLDGKKLATNPHLKPILIKAGSLGDGLPVRDMLVSPNHRVLVASQLTQLYFEEREVLAAAKHMTGARGVHSVDAMSTTYIHFMCERHEVVLSNGAWTESFQPGDYSLKGLGNSQRNEIFELFPELATQEGRDGYHAARKMLKKHEAKLLMK